MLQFPTVFHEAAADVLTAMDAAGAPETRELPTDLTDLQKSACAWTRMPSNPPRSGLCTCCSRTGPTRTCSAP
ncbi:hypothetical protein [Streptomyces rhizosphaericus]|uniref:hypothetical protein n=1 Tax=Streptomyces rhizosphaericus TaxID=114699 RepID=UPI00142D9AC5